MISTGNSPSGTSASPRDGLPFTADALIDGRDFAGRQIQGARALQEDSYGVIPRSEFSGGPGDLFAVVADGMGGHAAGEVASMLAVNTFAGTFLDSMTTSDAGRLWDCLEETNRRIAREITARGEAVEGMGTTLLAVLLRGRWVRWISVGDSPLHLVRGDQHRILNRIHSRAEELAGMVKLGTITEAEALQDPQRNALMSALTGDPIYAVDDPEPFALEAGDVLVAASDGLNSLTDDELAAIVKTQREQGAAAIATALLTAVKDKNHPKQDNATVVAIRIPG